MLEILFGDSKLGCVRKISVWSLKLQISGIPFSIGD